jgi:copper(I)-binding protein
MPESRWRQSWDGFVNRVPPERRASLPASVGAVAVLASLAVWGTLSGFAKDAPRDEPVAQVAQGTLPLPPPGATPTPAPAIPDPEAVKARAAALAAKANIDITDAWARATPGNANSAAVYLHIVSAKDPDKLLSADAAMAEKVEVQDDAQQNAKASVTAATEIPAGATVNFMPGGRHLTLTGLKSPLKEGDSFLLTLKFDKAGTQNTAVKILGASATGPAPSASARRGDTTSAVSPPP